jgi:hypothetical protein
MLIAGPFEILKKIKAMQLIKINENIKPSMICAIIIFFKHHNYK